MYCVYVLQNPKGILYKGQTDDIQKRVIQHNDPDGFPSYTKGRGPWKLVYVEEYSSRIEAKNRESFLKSGKGRNFLKEQLESDLAQDL